MPQKVCLQSAIIRPAHLTLKRHTQAFQIDNMHRIGTTFRPEQLDMLRAEGNEKVEFV
ncbi:hypothetical protein D3C78_723840 [compost metagenome]